ncbi:MAG TPA: aconitate hydratase AcnA [Candidatus Omnitrophota bacterium]|nr:aconitate hydratase AcnA [Candidatus Omnitrophota bacterium]
MKPSIRRTALQTQYGAFSYYKIADITQWGMKDPKRLPFSIKVLLESALRNCDGFSVTMDDIKRISEWNPKQTEPVEIAFKPGRVILQDFTGVPCVVDLAAMRSAMKALGGDILKINPQVRCDLVIDHSVQVDVYACADALGINMEKEFSRNRERYEFLKWGQNAFKNFSVVPPGVGIIHQVNLEYLADGVLKTDRNGETLVFPDSLIGTDSHTTMINGLGILGWGVGGIEAEAVMLGEPISMLLPDVIGFHLTGRLREGVTATDLVLTIVELLRKKGVVGKFVEFFGSGIQHLSLPDRATISNMAPEYGATTGIFPIDRVTLEYYAMTGRDPKQIDLIQQYMRHQGMFYEEGVSEAAEFSDMLELDLSKVEPSLAGPKRPQDRVSLKEIKDSFQRSLTAPLGKTGFGLADEDLKKEAVLPSGEKLSHGSVVIASITSCTNTSNPSVMVCAGLIAKKAAHYGLKVPSYVKTSLAPGSQVVSEYLENSKLLGPLEQLGFHIVGYGCATCIGNSGPLNEEVTDAVQKNQLVVASVLSGNRNFEGRVHPLTKANYLASPPLVVIYALAGRMDIDLENDPIGYTPKGKPVFFSDLWPTPVEIEDVINDHVTEEAFRKRYKQIDRGSAEWNAVTAKHDPLFPWDERSSYIQHPPFFDRIKASCGKIQPIQQARVLVKVGDSITTDHISPAGSIAAGSPAGKFLIAQGIEPKDFNSYGSRRGNDKVMTRGTFANIRLRSQIAPGTEGSWTIYFPTNEQMSIYDAAQAYKTSQTPLIVLAGKEYGTGSSRDWAAKGVALLGVRAVIAESFERIHRSNLAGMGILPLQFKSGETAETLGLDGTEVFDFFNIDETIVPRKEIRVSATKNDGKTLNFSVICRLDTPVEIDYFKNGGILHTVLRKLLIS